MFAIAPIYLVAIAIVAGDAVGVSLFAVPLWIAAMLAIAAALLFMRNANPAATAVAMVAIAAAISMPARESVAPRFVDSIRNFSDGAAITLEDESTAPRGNFPTASMSSSASSAQAYPGQGFRPQAAPFG